MLQHASFVKVYKNNNPDLNLGQKFKIVSNCYILQCEDGRNEWIHSKMKMPEMLTKLI